MPPHPLPLAETPAARRLVRELFRHPPWAHHPTCRCFDGHLLRIGRLALCLGCTCLAAGLITGGVALLWAWRHEPWLLHPWAVFGVGLLLFVPTLVQPFWQHKGFKAASRFALGLCLPCVLTAGLILPPLSALGWLARAGFVAFFLATYRFASWLRRRYTPDPCATCPHGRYPFCADNLPRVRRLITSSGAGEFAEGLRRLIDESPEGAAAALEALDAARTSP